MNIYKSERRKREMALYPEWIKLIKESTEGFKEWKQKETHTRKED